MLFPLLALVPRKEVQHSNGQNGDMNNSNSIEAPLLLESQRGEDDSRRSFDGSSFARDEQSPDQASGAGQSSRSPSLQTQTA